MHVLKQIGLKLESHQSVALISWTFIKRRNTMHPSSTYYCPTPSFDSAPPLHTLKEWLHIDDDHKNDGNIDLSNDNFPELNFESLKLSDETKSEDKKKEKEEVVQEIKEMQIRHEVKNDFENKKTKEIENEEKTKYNTKYAEHHFKQNELKKFIFCEHKKGNLMPFCQHQASKATVLWMRETNFKNINSIIIHDFRARYLVESWHVYDPMEIFNYGWFYLLRDDAHRIYAACLNQALVLHGIPLKFHLAGKT